MINMVEPIYYRHDDVSYEHVSFHLHDCFEVFFLMDGSLDYFIEKEIHAMRGGDIVITNTREIHMPAFEPGKNYDRVVLQFDPILLRQYKTPSFDVFSCFLDRPIGRGNFCRLTHSEQSDLKRIFGQMERVTERPTAEAEILKGIYLAELVVFLNSIYDLRKSDCRESPPLSGYLLEVLEYIDVHLDQCLSLETLEREFHISRYHLSRQFKRAFGSNIHQYISFKRISLAKELLAHGQSVTAACMNSGFNDYSNFLKKFKRTVGMTPGRYRQRMVNQSIR